MTTHEFSTLGGCPLVHGRRYALAVHHQTTPRIAYWDAEKGAFYGTLYGRQQWTPMQAVRKIAHDKGPPRDRVWYAATRRPSTKATIFEETIDRLVPQWGPYAKWTREQHAEHSRLLRARAGIAEDRPAVKGAA